MSGMYIAHTHTVMQSPRHLTLGRAGCRVMLYQSSVGLFEPHQSTPFGRSDCLVSTFSALLHDRDGEPAGGYVEKRLCSMNLQLPGGLLAAAVSPISMSSEVNTTTVYRFIGVIMQSIALQIASDHDMALSSVVDVRAQFAF